MSRSEHFFQGADPYRMPNVAALNTQESPHSFQRGDERDISHQQAAWTMANGTAIPNRNASDRVSYTAKDPVSGDAFFVVHHEPTNQFVTKYRVPAKTPEQEAQDREASRRANASVTQGQKQAAVNRNTQRVKQLRNSWNSLPEQKRQGFLDKHKLSKEDFG
jgi:hypothetical protein